MKKIWLLLFAIVLGGCNMSDSANEASVEEETETKEFTLTVNNLSDDEYEITVPPFSGASSRYNVCSGESVTVKKLPLYDAIIPTEVELFDKDSGEIQPIRIFESMIIDGSFTIDLLNTGLIYNKK